MGNGSYKNPVLYADYSDPDAVRVGGDYWLTSSSFSHVPGLPILYSRDLVNWTIVNHALPALVPSDYYSAPRHGGGVWAPSIRYHAGKYWIYYPDPDFGIYVVTATNPAGRWSNPVLVKAGKGLIDPCPLWDQDGHVWLVHAWARSRSGKNNILTLVQLSSDGMHATDEGRVIVDGNQFPGMHTLEGPKFYKMNGWYYIFAPTGGVTQGVQSVFRAKDIAGPYEHRVVMTQGSTATNGPHQGALIDAPDGGWWFLHFQDKGPFGRIVHLEPVTWHDGWPVIGADPNSTGVGEPVLSYRKPVLIRHPFSSVPQTSDEFGSPKLGLQWQWQANPKTGWASLTARPGFLRLIPVETPAANGLFNSPNLLLQKFPAPEFTVTSSLEFAPAVDGESAGLVVFGDDYAWIGMRRAGSATRLVQIVNRGASKGAAERESASAAISGSRVFLRVTVDPSARCRFSYSMDGISFTALGDEFTATVGRWVGAKVGLFAVAPPGAPSAGHADFDWFRVSPK